MRKTYATYISNGVKYETVLDGILNAGQVQMALLKMGRGCYRVLSVSYQ